MDIMESRGNSLLVVVGLCMGTVVYNTNIETLKDFKIIICLSFISFINIWRKAHFLLSVCCWSWIFFFSLHNQQIGAQTVFAVIWTACNEFIDPFWPKWQSVPLMFVNYQTLWLGGTQWRSTEPEAYARVENLCWCCCKLYGSMTKIT